MHQVARTREGLKDERGAVMVMVAIWLPLLALFVSFAVDVGHFFDYSRNLQNRADAAALAAGDAYGTTCFGSPTGGQLDGIGHTAQQYAGPPDPNGGTYPAGNLPYLYSSVTGYQNQPNLTKGTFDKFFMVLNGAKSAADGGTSFTDGSFCAADYTNPPSPAVDVWLTQKNLPLFFPMLGFTPNISAHARVSLRGEASSPFIRPIAVSDPGAFGCATVKFFKSNDPTTPIATADLTETDPTNFKFDNSANPVSVPIPNDDNGNGANVYVYMQVFLSDCNGNGETFDDSTNSGINVINSYGTATPGATGPPQITAGGVTLCQVGSGNQVCAGTQTCDPYFSVGGCNVSVTAHVTFNSSFTNPNANANVTACVAVRTTGLCDPSFNPIALSPDNTGTVWTPNGNKSFNIADSTGQYLIRLDWSQTKGTVNGQNCQTTTCKGTFGIQQQAFGACNGCDQPDDSGPIIAAQICNSATGSCDTNAFQQTSATNPAPNLVVKLQLAGIRAQVSSSTPAPVTILRFSGSTNHQTGLIDCGQGNGPGGSSTPGDAYTIYGGCGPSNPFEPPQCASVIPPNTAPVGCKLPVMNPLYIYGRGNPIDCSPAVDQDYTDWPSGNHQDCVQTTPGSRRVSIVCGLLQRITGVQPANFSASSSACNSNFGGTCPANNWGGTIPANDLRTIDVVLVAPIDLAAVDGSPQAWVPIRKIASFYVTGWDPSLFPNCPNNDPFPGKGKQSSNGAIWGHWFSDSENGIPGPNACDLTSIEPVNCVPVLTR